MSRTSPSPDDLRIFVRVARLASFTRAAQQLDLPRATVSTAVLRLEGRLGARLLQRTTRRVHLTSDGESFLARCEAVLEDLDELGALFQQRAEQVSGRLRVDMSLGMSTGLLMSRLPEFIARHPALRLEICSTDRRGDVIGEGFDCVIRAGQVVDESLSSRPLGAMAMVNVASAGYIERFGLPKTLEELETPRLVDYRANPADVSAEFEYFRDDLARTIRVPMQSLVTVNNSAAYLAACRAGLGIIQVPKSSAELGIGEGVLVEVLPAYRPAPMPMSLLFPHRRNLPRRVRVFADWVLEVFKSAA